MFEPSAPRGYVTGEYLDYQKKYARNIRESDKVLIQLIQAKVPAGPFFGQPPSLLDIGCSNGNLLVHLKNFLPGLDYHGGDLFPEIIEYCRRNPELAGVHFEVMDIRDLAAQARFDLVVANAVLHRFRDEEFSLSLASIARSLRPGGWFFSFDFYHPFEQELVIGEKSRLHPEGLTLVVHPYSKMVRLLEANGFAMPEFQPFSIPIDLEKPGEMSNINTYTIRTDQGERLNFRGSLFLPWCHLAARKG